MGSIMFMTQILVLLQALLFILVFIFLPLWVFKRKSVRSIPAAAIGPFIMYFACLGCGFMFIEIPMMQKFVLMLGSPIYSISVILALLLISTGIGSFSLPSVEKMFKSHVKLIRTVTALLIMYVFFMVTAGSFLADRALGMGFAAGSLLSGCWFAPSVYCWGFISLWACISSDIRWRKPFPGPGGSTADSAFLRLCSPLSLPSSPALQRYFFWRRGFTGWPCCLISGWTPG